MRKYKRVFLLLFFAFFLVFGSKGADFSFALNQIGLETAVDNTASSSLELMPEHAASEKDTHGEDHGDDHSGGHGGPVIPVLLQLVVILLAAKIGGDIALRLGQPEVLGELVVGVVLGSASLVGIDAFSQLKESQIIEILSELGVILLLFEVGLETNIKEMMQVGTSSLLAAILGVVAPFFLGWAVAWYFIPDANILAHVFIGATLTATSVGITARVLKDLGKIQTKEAKIILGAAVIDDVLGLLTLAVVAGIISAANSGQELEIFGLVKIVLYSFGFLIGAVAVGQYASPAVFKVATYLRSHGMLLATSLTICFGLAYISSLVGLAPIVGSFTAGLILEQVHYRDLATRQNNVTIEELIAPITALLVPIFFVIMGARVDISVFKDPSILGFATVLTIAAIIGKQVCSFGVVDKKLDRVVVGLGMIPRGEVGLIFIGIGAGLVLNGEPVIDAATFGAVVIMVIVTTMATPPLIKWRFRKNEEAPEELKEL